MTRRPSIIETLPDWAHGLLVLFITAASTTLGSLL